MDVQTESITIGTCTADEQETLDKLFHLGITSSPTTETGKILSEDIPPPYDLPASESETANSYDPAIKLDKLESTPQPSMSSAAASTYRQPTAKVKPLTTKLPEELDILDDYPPLDIPLPSKNDPDFESDKNDDQETSPDEPVIEEPKYMKLYRTYIKSDLHVSLTRLSKDEIQQKTSRKPTKPCRKAITPRPVTVKANQTSARKYILKLTRYGVRHKNHKNYHHTCVGKKCHTIFKSL